ncbi:MULTISPECIES: LysR substrate-binding domain-containing protein [Pseudomonas]|uniref:LysR family transcriptional regulator n=1 Tax=Pseudomonas tohonis TaxID=2725477 RepID=A0A6J4DZ25_9PSED|nr:MULTISPECIES: LysR substrate-binding domain-containing protein [Pseudomonas]UXY53866.1 LysR substrate-binding domain-containing protein [Pseudomonas tohonis]BBP81313.1 LysR family transcriptional regulator [Pseudomonas sp. Pc102]BCG22883.1 LysR family transcriptional regulator [Pseudomonas tohonis]GJN53430.1 LysR family transcriptional regulator [Pseudomonas tohonis]
MDLRLLRYFSVLADELHFGRAATRLHMSQPPLSQQIRLLEEALGTRLFERSHHRVELTEAGRTLKQQVPLVFEQLNRALDLTRQTARGQLGELEIGMISSVMVGVLPRALNRFRVHYPDVRWRLHEMTPAAQLMALKEHRIDVCVFRVGHDDPGLRNELLLYEPLRAVLPAEHPLAQQASLAPVDLAGEFFVTLELNQSSFANFLVQCCVQVGFSPLIRQQVIEVQTLLGLVQAGFGVALLPASLEQLAPAGVVFRRLQPPLPEVPLYAIYRAGDDSAVLQRFLETLREQSAAERGMAQPLPA